MQRGLYYLPPPTNIQHNMLRRTGLKYTMSIILQASLLLEPLQCSYMYTVSILSESCLPSTGHGNNLKGMRKGQHHYVNSTHAYCNITVVRQSQCLGIHHIPLKQPFLPIQALTFRPTGDSLIWTGLAMYGLKLQIHVHSRVCMMDNISVTTFSYRQGVCMLCIILVRTDNSIFG